MVLLLLPTFAWCYFVSLWKNAHGGTIPTLVTRGYYWGDFLWSCQNANITSYDDVVALVKISTTLYGIKSKFCQQLMLNHSVITLLNKLSWVQLARAKHNNYILGGHALITECILRILTATSLGMIDKSLFLIGQIPYWFPAWNYASSLWLWSNSEAAKVQGTSVVQNLMVTVVSKLTATADCVMTSVGQSISVYFWVR